MAPMRESKKEFFLGSIFPDSFYYHSRKDITAISDRLHGRGENAGRIIIGFLRAAKKQHAINDYVFTMGYISHWSLDKIFHPIIAQLCGDAYTSDSGKRRNLLSHHRLLETDLDLRVNNGCYVHEMIDLKTLSGLNAVRLLAEHSQTNEAEFITALRRQKRINRMMTKKWAYIWARLLTLMGKKGMDEVLPLFYAHLKFHRETFPDAIYDESLENEDKKYRSVEDLFSAAEAFARSVFRPAYGFLNSTSDKENSFLEKIERLLEGSV